MLHSTIRSNARPLLSSSRSILGASCGPMHHNASPAKTTSVFYKLSAPSSQQQQQQQQQIRQRSDNQFKYKFPITTPDLESRIVQYCNKYINNNNNAAQPQQQQHVDVYYELLQPVAGSSNSGKQDDTIHPTAKVLFHPVGQYALGRRDIWLVRRDGEKWLCKTPFREDVTLRSHLSAKDPRETIPSYREISGERDIRIELNLQQDVTMAKEHLKSLEESLKERGIVPYATITTTSTTYSIPFFADEQQQQQHRDAEIDPDVQVEVISTDFGYKMATVSIMVRQAAKSNTGLAMRRLVQLLDTELEAPHVPHTPMPIVEYIYRNNKADYYRALVKAGVAAERD